MYKIGGIAVKMDNLYIVMPAYNEEENIEKVVREWYPIVESKGTKSKLIIADSGSSDNTHDILLDLKKEFKQLEILEKTEKQHGPKVIALYDYAIKSKADYVFQTDSDGQTNPDEFEFFWQIREQYTGVFGNRCNRGDGKARAFVEHIVCFMLKLYFNVNIPDANAPFRLMKTDVLKKYLYKLDANYNIPNIMITTYFTYYKEKICFKPISFKPRQAGNNSINFNKIIKIGIQAIKDFKKLRKGMKVDVIKKSI